MEIKTRTSVQCINCRQFRILRWNNDYAQWLCDKCETKLPTKGIRYRRARSKLMNRKYALRDVNKWLKINNLLLEDSTK